MRYLFRQFDTTVCNGIFSGFLAFCQFVLDGGDWVYGALLAVISVMCFISYSEICDYKKKIIRSEEKIKELEEQIKKSSSKETLK